MRVASGSLARRTLVAPPGDATRPTSEKLRDALFQHLRHRLEHGLRDARVLDLFAGSGALAFEAISAGAAHATLVDASPAAARAIRQNIAALQLEAVTALVVRDVAAALPRLEGHFDLILLDPPYAFDAAPLGPLIAPLCTPTTLVVYEHATRRDSPTLPGLAPGDARRYGDTTVSFFALAGDSARAES
ncbi:MAG: RsmD family RNA methyltransferase [Myxococcales bacterium]|nr:RsmD family RNA methyltransferase [Myxococcales bacterium]MCB9533450.1 RsmD family RNA methyltransferase [Myxococcales bacterium]